MRGVSGPGLLFCCCAKVEWMVANLRCSLSTCMARHGQSGHLLAALGKLPGLIMLMPLQCLQLSSAGHVCTAHCSCSHVRQQSGGRWAKCSNSGVADTQIHPDAAAVAADVEQSQPLRLHAAQNSSIHTLNGLIPVGKSCPLACQALQCRDYTA